MVTYLGMLLDKKEDVGRVFQEAKQTAEEDRPVLINALVGKTDFRAGSISMWSWSRTLSKKIAMEKPRNFPKKVFFIENLKLTCNLYPNETFRIDRHIEIFSRDCRDRLVDEPRYGATRL